MVLKLLVLITDWNSILTFQISNSDDLQWPTTEYDSPLFFFLLNLSQFYYFLHMAQGCQMGRSYPKALPSFLGLAVLLQCPGCLSNVSLSCNPLDKNYFPGPVSILYRTLCTTYSLYSSANLKKGTIPFNVMRIYFK